MNSVVQSAPSHPSFKPDWPEASLPFEERRMLTPALLRLWQTAMRWRWVVLGSILGSVLIGLFITLLLPSYYTATAQVEIDRVQKEITKLQGVEPSNREEDIEFYATQYQLLVARPVLERVASELGLYDSDAFFVAHGIVREDAFDGEYNLSEESKRARVERLVVNTLEDHVIVDPVRTSRLVDIGYSSRSPTLSASIANAWTGAFIGVSMDRQLSSTADARRILEDRLAALRRKVEETEREVINYASDQDIVSLDRVLDDRGRTVETRTLVANDLDTLNAALNVARSARAVAQARLIESGENTTESVSSQLLAQLRQREAELQARYAELMIQFTPEYPAAVAVNEQIEAIQGAIAREHSRIALSREQEFREALERENVLQGQVDGVKERLGRLQRSSIQYAVLQRERDTNKQLYDALLQRYKEIGVTGTVGLSNVSVVERATVPLDPSFPNIPLSLALSLLIGLFIASGAVYALEHIDEGIREPNDVRDRLGLPLLGYTTRVEDDPVELLRDSKTEYYDANFSVHANLALATAHGFPRSLSVTSTEPNEGKSSVALALAVVLGRLGRSVILIDGDMRSPSVHEFFGIGHDNGLSNVLAGDRDWRTSVQSTEFRGLKVMTAGPKPPNAAELLSNDGLSKFVDEALKEFDHVIIDSPPVLGLSDAPALAKTLEGCVYICQAGGAPLRVVLRSIDRLRAARVQIFGAVVTKFDEVKDGYGYGYGYDFQYGPDSDARSSVAA